MTLCPKLNGGKQSTAMGRTLGWVFLIFCFLTGITVRDKDDRKSHGMAVSVNHAELTQSASAQSDKANGSSKFEEELLITCSSQGGTEVKQGLLEISAAANVIPRSNNNVSDSVIMKLGGPCECELDNIEDMEELTLPVEEDYTSLREWEEYCRQHHRVCTGSEIGMYRLDAYIGPLGLEAIALHSPDYVYHPISLALPDSGRPRQDDDLGLQVRLGEELVAQDHLLTVPQFEYFDFYDEQEELLLSRLWLLKRRFAGGSFGDVWRGEKCSGGEKHGLGKSSYVLKRMLQEKGNYVLSAGRREIYFGKLIVSHGGHRRIARFVESFFVEAEKIKKEEEFEEEIGGSSREGYVKQQKQKQKQKQNFTSGADLWLVFRDEGMSLRQLMYTRRKARNFFIYTRSNFWLKLKHSPGLFKEVIRQLLQGVLWLHRLGIVHRDIKPSNLIIRTDTGKGSNNNPLGELRIADFSSAIDEGVQNAGFYKPHGPMTTESTLGYAPPEVRLSSTNEQPFSSDFPTSYDMWSIGVVVLELILGTPEVFTLNQRTQAVLAHELDRGRGGEERINNEDILFLASLADMCIYHPAAHGGKFYFEEAVIEVSRNVSLTLLNGVGACVVV